MGLTVTDFQIVLELAFLRPYQHSLEPYKSYGKEGERFASLSKIQAHHMPKSGITFHQAQVALAKIYTGSEDVSGDVDEVVNIEQPHDQTTGVDEIGKKDTVQNAVRLPKTMDEAKDIINRFQQAAQNDDKHV